MNCPADRLLTYKMGDGWEPICRLLGEPVPKRAFPHSNKKGSIVDDLMQSNAPYSARKQIEGEFFRRMAFYVVVGGLAWQFRSELSFEALASRLYPL